MVSGDSKDATRKAIEWFVRWSERDRPAGSREQSRWIGWLQRSPEHVGEYFAVEDLCARLAESQALKRFDVDAWMTQRRARIVELGSRLQGDKSTARAKSVTGRHWAIAAALAIVSLAGGFWWYAHPGPSYRTGIGEQKTVQLADGSTLELNTRSRARVLFDEHAREIELTGEALFTVAQDPRRPFVVRTHDATVRALGTRFNVYEQARATRVAVLEGRVRLMSKTSGQTFDLNAGEEARVANGTPRKEAKANIAAATAWQSRTLVFERAKLVDVAAEFNRYNRLQFRVDPTISDANRLSGTFDAQHPESLLLWLQGRSDMAVSQQGDTYVVREVPRRAVTAP